MKKEIPLIRPLLPKLGEIIPHLEKIWENQWLTNEGEFHNRLEEELKHKLGVPFLSLMSNGTLPLITALHALHLKGEIITTPYSFVGTTHAITWQGLTPVFVDVEPESGCIDPKRIEEAITPATSAILGVHIYGNPCATEEIEDIASRHNLKVIYDAAHTFCVEQNGESILLKGDISTLSFHATKVFNTAEGGALVTSDPEINHRVRDLRNFGIESETDIVCPGINSKMDEIRAALGLANLNYVEQAISSRKKVDETYRELLWDVEGISLFHYREGIKPNFGYFPIFIDEKKFGISRDSLYQALKEKGIYTRRYFYPLISNLDFYRHLPSANPINLPMANKMSETVLCLPCHPALTQEDIYSVSEALKDAKR